MGGMSRRGLIGSAGLGAAAALGTAGAMALDGRAHEASATPAPHTVTYFGAHQAGVVTAAQDRLHFAAFDLNASATRADLVVLLTAWTAAAARMTQGKGAGELGPLSGPYDAPPDDTGEAIGLDPGNLTITFGFGPSLFRDASGKDRFSLAARQPDALRRLPVFPRDSLAEASSDGDLCIQACSDDPQVAVHAIRNLTRIAFGRASLRWSQLGFGRTSSTTSSQITPRNLFGFKDGTANLRAEEPNALAAHVWVRPGADPKAAWLEGGSYLVARKIAMHVETWDRGSLREQERLVGRTKAEGAPMSGGSEFTKPDFALRGRGDAPLIDENSHVALAHPERNNGVQMLRRGYNYVDGSNQLGRLAAGLFFIAYVTDPRTHYIPMQARMATSDLMAEYLQHVGSGLWAVPPGVREGEYVGQPLFA
jgi:deferrochelatase/peroxidase EfeB